MYNRQYFTDRMSRIIRNSTTSPLHRLPLELRQKIWSYLLGRKTGHVMFHTDRLSLADLVASSVKVTPTQHPGKSTRVVRECEQPLQEANSNSEEHATKMEFHTNPARCYKHYHIYDRTSWAYDPRPFRPEKRETPAGLDIPILRVCRQVYAEANTESWKTTTWSFKHSLPFG